MSDGLYITELVLTLSEMKSVISRFISRGFICSSVDGGRRMKGLDSISTSYFYQSVENRCFGGDTCA